MYNIICSNKNDYRLTFEVNFENQVQVANWLKCNQNYYDDITIIEILPNNKKYLLCYRTINDCYVNCNRFIKYDIEKHFKTNFLQRIV